MSVTPRYDPRLPAELMDLHIHVGGAVAPHILFSIAHQAGFKLPVRDYWSFVDMVTVKPERTKNLDDYLKVMHEWTEKIQSSPAAIERSVYEIIGKEYRGSNVTRMELRFNPMKRNLHGERDLDAIIQAAIHGMDDAVLEYGSRCGLIFCLAREFSVELNDVILQKAIKFRDRGVIGIDLAGPESMNVELRATDAARYEELFRRARNAGLKTTVHTGETPHTSGEGVLAVLRLLKPDRIGHGIRAAYNQEALDMLASSGTVLEICPSSNLSTHAVKDIQELGHILKIFQRNKIGFTINTDGPYLMDTNLAQECTLLMDAGVLTPEEIAATFVTAQKASFLP